MKESKTFKEGVLWSLASVIILALSGFVLNILIGTVYDASTLGVFNQVLATYVFFSMFAGGGVNLSTLKLIAETADDEERVHEVVVSAVALTILCSLVVTILYWFARLPISSWLGSAGVREGMMWIAPGLFFFGINKTLLSVLNGLHQIKALSVFQGLRYLNLLVGFFIALWLHFPGERLAYVFTLSESILFVALTLYLRRYWKAPSTSSWKHWMLIHARFASKAVLSGALLELNSRIDVLILGHFCDDEITGIYSFAAMVFEGLMQLFFVLQNNYNPHLSRLLHTGEHEDLLTAFRNGRRTAYKYALLLVPIAIFAYPLAISVVFHTRPEFMASWLPFSILIGGLLLSSGYIPFQNILAMGGHPGWHTVFMLITVCSNIVLNWFLVPHLGMIGAALGMALSLSFSSVTLVMLTQLRLRISLI